MYKIYNDLTSKDREWKELDGMKEYLKSEVVHDIWPGNKLDKGSVENVIKWNRKK